MTSGRTRTGASAVLESFNVMKEWRGLAHFVVRYIGWLLLCFIGVIYLLSPELRAGGLRIDRWLLSYLGYLIAVEVFSQINEEFYETSLFRMARIQATALLGSVLVVVSGGSESYFWFIYLLPLFASALYFPSWTVTWRVYSEVVVLYFLSSWIAADGVASVNFVLLLINLAVLFVLAMVLRYLMESIRRYQATERALKYSELLQQMQSEETSKQIDQMALADEVGKLLSGTQIPQLLVEKAMEVFDVEAGSLALINAMTRKIEFQFALDYRGNMNVDEIMRGFKLSVDKGIAGAVAQSGEAIISNNVQADPRWYKEIDDITGFTTKSILAVPLIYGDQVIGVIEILNKRDGSPFLEPEKDLLSAVASSAAIAIENIRLFNRIQKQIQQERTLRQEADGLRKAFDAMSASLDLDVVAEKILDGVGRIIEYRTASLQLIQGDDRTLLAGRGFDVEAVDLRLLRPISKDPLVSRIVASKEPLILGEPLEDPDWTSTSTPDVKSWIGLPLVYNQETIGLLTLDHDQSGFYTWDSKDLLVSFASRAAIDIQKAYLFGSAQHRIRDLEIVNKIVQVISTKLDTQDLLQTIIFQITDLLKCTHCTIFFPKKENGHLVLLPDVVQGIHIEQIKTRRFRPGEPDEGLAGWVFRNGQSLVLNDARDDSRFAPARKRQDQPRSMLISPVKVANKTICVISADQDEFGWFSENDLRLVDTLTQQVGIAIERATTLELFQEVGKQIISLQKKGDILRKIVSGAIELTNTDTGIIFLLSEDGRSITDSFYPPGFEHPEPRLSKEDGITHHVFMTGEVLAISDIHQNSRVNPELFEHFRSMIAVPLKVEQQGKTKQQVIGVLFLNAKDFHEFTETEISLLSALANQAAIAIGNATLIEETRLRLEELRTFHSIALDIAEQSESKQILKNIIGKAVKLLGAYGGGILLNYPREEEVRMAFMLNLDAMRDFSCKFGEGMAGYVAESGEPLMLDDYQTWEYREPNLGEDPYGHLFKAVIYVPVKLKSEVLGVLFVFDNRRDKTFNKTDLGRLDRIANLSAIAIGNAREHTYLQSLVSVSPDAIIGIDRKGYIIQFNKASEEILGFTKEEVVGQPVAQYYYEGEKEARRVNHKLVEAGDKGLKGYKTYVKGNDEKKIPIRLAGMNLCDETGRRIGSFGVMTDLREKNALLKNQREGDFLVTLERFPQDKPIRTLSDLNKRLTEQLNMACQFCQLEYLVLFASIKENETVLPAIACSEGVPSHIASNLPHFNWRKAELQPWYSSWDELLKYETDLINRWGPDENIHQRINNGIRGGQKDFFESTAYMIPLRLADNYRSVLVFGPFTGEIGIMNDAEFLKSVNLTISTSALSWLQALYLRTEQEKAETSAQLITHRTLMELMQVNGKFGFIKRLTDEDSRAHLKAVEGERIVEQLSISVRQAFKTGVIDMEPEDYYFQEHSLATLVQNCIESFREFAEKEGKELRVELSVENLPYANIDSRMLSIALYNLLDNALKYSFGNTYISIKAEYDTKMARITITDVGWPMSEEARTNLSIPGQRWNVSAGAHRVSGMGLGLWEASTIVHSHKGEVSFSSVPFPRRGRDAYRVSVWVDLPLRQS